MRPPVLKVPEVASPPASLQIAEITPVVPERATPAPPAEPASALPVEPEAQSDKQQPVQGACSGTCSKTDAPAAEGAATLKPLRLKL